MNWLKTSVIKRQCCNQFQFSCIRLCVGPTVATLRHEGLLVWRWLGCGRCSKDFLFSLIYLKAGHGFTKKRTTCPQDHGDVGELTTTREPSRFSSPLICDEMLTKAYQLKTIINVCFHKLLALSTQKHFLLLFLKHVQYVHWFFTIKIGIQSPFSKHCLFSLCPPHTSEIHILINQLGLVFKICFW